MNIKTLQKAQDIYHQLVTLDGEIIAIDKEAQYLAQHTVTVNLAMNVPSKEKQSVKDPSGNLIDPNDEPKFTYLSHLYSSFNFMDRGQKTASEYRFEMNLSEVEALAVLGTIIQFKKEKRRGLLNELEQLGYQV
jgi:hypothetical protein